MYAAMNASSTAAIPPLFVASSCLRWEPPGGGGWERRRRALSVGWAGVNSIRREPRAGPRARGAPPRPARGDPPWPLGRRGDTPKTRASFTTVPLGSAGTKVGRGRRGGRSQSRATAWSEGRGGSPCSGCGRQAVLRSSAGARHHPHPGPLLGLLSSRPPAAPSRGLPKEGRASWVLTRCLMETRCPCTA